MVDRALQVLEYTNQVSERLIWFGDKFGRIQKDAGRYLLRSRWIFLYLYSAIVKKEDDVRIERLLQRAFRSAYDADVFLIADILDSIDRVRIELQGKVPAAVLQPSFDELYEALSQARETLSDIYVPEAPLSRLESCGQRMDAFYKSTTELLSRTENLTGEGLAQAARAARRDDYWMGAALLLAIFFGLTQLFVVFPWDRFNANIRNPIVDAIYPYVERFISWTNHW